MIRVEARSLEELRALVEGHRVTAAPMGRRETVERADGIIGGFAQNVAIATLKDELKAVQDQLQATGAVLSSERQWFAAETERHGAHIELLKEDRDKLRAKLEAIRKHVNTGTLNGQVRLDGEDAQMRIGLMEWKDWIAKLRELAVGEDARDPVQKVDGGESAALATALAVAAGELRAAQAKLEAIRKHVAAKPSETSAGYPSWVAGLRGLVEG